MSRQICVFNQYGEVIISLGHMGPCSLGFEGNISFCFENDDDALYLSVNAFSTKVLIRNTILTSANGDGTAILRGHPSHAKASPLAVQREYLHF